ncbi:unnamed protein product [Adineta steineri]|uniref:Formate/nitrite transporter n=1 Tax=Adineta steineri TaxID=433720 RepID=A0A814HWD2_9BILA|nr:unnamed protein product [Adineta steineri]CAF1424043.1 unnamed protein product [Adineta steineri]CAF1457907.1 unnamed protein product [Adineta steineri]
MSLNDAYNIYETIEYISAIGVRKSKQKIDHMIIKSFLAGVLLSFGGLFCLAVGGGRTLLAQNFGPGIHKTIQAAVFPIGLILVIVTGADLFIGNTMVLVISTLHKTTTWINLLISWSNTPSYQMFLRGIGGNWLVCLSFCLSTSVRDLNSKIIVQMGMLLGANLSIGNYILNVLIPVALGNILGGSIFVGFIYWYLYLAKKT